MSRDPAALLRRLSTALDAALGEKLTGLLVAGSYVTGDFAPERSDLDLLAVLSSDPNAATLAVLAPLHTALEAEFPAWAGRVEVEYVTAQAVRDVHARGHVIARISPGEALHLLPATPHRLVGWYLARRYGRTLRGPAPAELLPGISEEEFRAAVAAHLADWPGWVRSMTSPGGQAYAVLSVCRSLAVLSHGLQVSKRQAATVAARDLPDEAGLVRWAERWWYEGGSDDERSRLAEAVRFVENVRARVLATQAADPDDLA